MGNCIQNQTIQNQTIQENTTFEVKVLKESIHAVMSKKEHYKLPKLISGTQMGTWWTNPI